MSNTLVYVVMDGHNLKVYQVLRDVGRDYPVSYRTLLRHIGSGGIYIRRSLRVQRVELESRRVPHPGGFKFH